MDARFLIFQVLVLTAVMVAGVAGQRRMSKPPTRDEELIMMRALRTYDKANQGLLPRPKGPQQALPVAVDFSLTAVTDLNKKKGYVELEGMMTLSWQDVRLRYNGPLQIDSVTIRIDPKKIWTPDIELWNMIHPGIQTVNVRQQALISSSGDVNLINQIRTRSRCDVAGQLYRSDVANCTLTFGSWTHSGVDIQPKMNNPQSAILREFQVSSLWNVTSATAWVDVKLYPCCEEPYPSVKFSFLLQKRARV